jgi:hypothetical protein
MTHAVEGQQVLHIGTSSMTFVNVDGHQSKETETRALHSILRFFPRCSFPRGNGAALFSLFFTCFEMTFNYEFLSANLGRRFYRQLPLLSNQYFTVVLINL